MNVIGIEQDVKKIKRLLGIGILGACVILMGDLLMGWGVKDESLTGIAASLSPYLAVSDTRMVLASIFGILGVPLAVVGHFGIYKLLKPRGGNYASGYAIGMAGFLLFGGAGVHGSSVEGAFFYKSLVSAGVGDVLDLTVKYALYFLLPLYAILIASWIVMVYCHIRILLKGRTPFPKWGILFSMLVGTILVCPVGLLGNQEVVNALMMGAFSFGNIWTLGGHLWILNRAEKNRTYQSRLPIR